MTALAARRYGTLSPLRYPGGKASLAGLFADLLHELQLPNATYVEPYAGGAGAGIALLRQDLIEHLVINDLDPAVHAFWHSATQDHKELIRLVETTPLNIPEWRRQREIYRACNDADPLELGFAFFYLNRTNRSGVLQGGVIGGLQQAGTYKIDARFNRSTLKDRLMAIAHRADQITVTNTDGRTTILAHQLDSNTFMYIDPPYVQAGSMLYLNAFTPRDHSALSLVVNSIHEAHWLMTYDNAPLIQRLYSDRFQMEYALNYSSHNPGRKTELMITSELVASALERTTFYTTSQLTET